MPSQSVQQQLDEILEKQRKIEFRLNIITATNVLRIVILLVPIILGVIYLPPLIENMFSGYQQLFSGGSAAVPATAIPNILSSVSEQQLQQVLELLAK